MPNWSVKSFGDKMNDVNVMVTGLRGQISRVSRRGINEEFINNLETNMNEARTLDTEQEKLKADLKKKTAKLDELVAVLNKMMDEAKRVVKLEFDQEEWKEFGVTDKR
ncbi:MAG: hypothetical protein JSV88_28475 [Candidatus Aminicenantes bacterium]|nr:MAG: hypothetical protein JSV88_28475 [Candidatus Aminicenantes bacterium]